MSDFKIYVLSNLQKVMHFLSTDPVVSDPWFKMKELAPRIKADRQGRVLREYIDNYHLVYDLVKSQFPEFATDPKVKTILEELINRKLDLDTLNHVLDRYEEFIQKKISYAQGFNQGTKFIREKYQLPDDFFNQMPESDTKPTPKSED